MRRFLPLLLLTLCSVTYSQGRSNTFYQVEALGADPSETAAVNTTAIQTTLNTAGMSGGGTVTLTRAGTYLIEAQGAHPYIGGRKYCIDFKFDNIEFYIGSGVTIKLADGQQVNGAPVDMFVFAGRKNLSIIGAASGASTITANAAGQTGWTQGYAQVSHGIIISGFGGGGVGNSNLTIKHLTLKDHFSNPLNVDVFPTSGRNTNVRVEDVHSIDCGEGIQVGAADGVWIDNCLVESPNHVAVGDAIELSGCTQFLLRNNVTRNHRSGSGFDIFGSSDGIIDDWISDDNVNGMDIHAFGDVPDPKNVTAINGVITNPRGVAVTDICNGLGISAASLHNIKVKNILMKGTAFSYGFQIAANGNPGVEGPVTLEDCVIDGGVHGILLVAGITDLTIRGGRYSNLSGSGFAFASQGDGIEIKNLTINGMQAVNNGGWGILIDNQGHTLPAITGSIKDCYLENNTGGPFNVGGPEASGLTVEDNLPSTKTALGDFFGTSAAIVYGVRFLSPTGGIVRTFRFPSANQVLTLTFPEPTTVFDARQTGGNNIFLSQAVNGIFKAGDLLTLRYNGNAWQEVSRSLNTP